MISNYQKAVIIFFAAVLSRLAYQYVTGFTADDAFITFRYAENIAAGHGFVYNLGEKVLGTSTPLFTLILSFFAVFTVKTIHAALLVSVLASGLTAVLIFRLAIQLRFGRFAWIPSMVYILWPRSLAADSSGMETALFTLLVLAAFYYKRKRMFFYAVGLATAASLTRPEGVFALILLAGFSVYHDRPNWKAYLGIPLLLIVPWLIFSQIYFGSIVPHSITAKLALYSQFGAESYWDHLVYLMGWHQPWAWALTVLAIAGGYWLNRRQAYGGLEIIWMLSMLAFYTFSRTHLFSWYIVPIYPLFILFFCADVAILSEQNQISRNHPILTRWMIVVIFVVGLTSGVVQHGAYHRDFQAYMEAVNMEVGSYLYRYGDSDNDRAAVEDIGYIGYYSKMRILDRDGLISPEAPSYNRRAAYLELILDQRPDWVGAAVGSPISGFINDSLFLKTYSLEKKFGDKAEWEYNLYSLR